MYSQTFILRLRLSQSITQDEAVELLGVAACTDVLVGLGESGVLAVAFTGPVVLSEIAEVARAIPAAEVVSFSAVGELSS